MKDVGNSTGERGLDSTTVVLGKWATTIYGFVEADTIYDTTQSLNDAPGMAQIQRPGGKPGTTPGGTYAGDNDRTQFGVRNFAHRPAWIKAPEVHGIRVSGQAEMDFLGTQLPICYANQPNASGFGAVNTGYCVARSRRSSRTRRSASATCT